jgi:hypothetical protein
MSRNERLEELNKLPIARPPDVARDAFRRRKVIAVPRRGPRCGLGGPNPERRRRMRKTASGPSSRKGDANLVSFRADPKMKAALAALKRRDESLGLIAKSLLGLLLALLEAGKREMEGRAKLSPEEMRRILRATDDIPIRPETALLLPAEAARRLSSDQKGKSMARKLRNLSPAGAAALAVELLRMRKGKGNARARHRSP